MRTLRLIVLGLVLFIGLMPAGSGEASVTQWAEGVSLPEGASAGWWATVQGDIGRSET